MLFVSKKKDALSRGILAFLFFIFPCFLLAQAAQPSAAGQDEQAQIQPRSGRETNESLILIEPPVSSSEDASGSSASARTYSSAGSILRLIVVLILLCVACYFFIRFLKKSQRAPYASDPFLKMTAFLSLGQEKSVTVVTIGGRAFLLGIADNSVSLIAEITDTELIDQMNLTSGITSQSQKSFVEALSELIPKFRQKGESPFSSAEETADFIRKRRSSLKKIRSEEQ